jgi:Rrf2 family iron-sulfur cluster assembly transcriptional regulator
MTHELWSTLNRKMVDFLDSVSLQDLVDQQRLRQIQEASKSSGAGVRVNVVGANGAPLNAETASISL